MMDAGDWVLIGINGCDGGFWMMRNSICEENRGREEEDEERLLFLGTIRGEKLRMRDV